MAKEDKSTLSVYSIFLVDKRSKSVGNSSLVENSGDPFTVKQLREDINEFVVECVGKKMTDYERFSGELLHNIKNTGLIKEVQIMFKDHAEHCEECDDDHPLGGQSEVGMAVLSLQFAKSLEAMVCSKSFETFEKSVILSDEKLSSILKKKNSFSRINLKDAYVLLIVKISVDV